MKTILSGPAAVTSAVTAAKKAPTSRSQTWGVSICAGDRASGRAVGESAFK